MPNSLATPWTVACQTLLSMGFPRQAYWSGLPFPSPGDLPDPGIEPTFPMSSALQVDSLSLSHWGRFYTHTHTHTHTYIDTHTYIYRYSFSESFPYRLLQNIECNSLCFTVGPCWLSILNIVVCTCYSQIQFCISFCCFAGI